LLGCGDGLFTFSVAEEAELVVEQGTVLETLVGDLGFGEFVSMDITANQGFANQGVEPGDISEVELVSFSLSASEPDGADLSFLDSVELFVEAPELPRVRVAVAEAFPVGQPTVAFGVDPIDLAPYVVSRSMTLSAEVEGRRPDQDITVVAAFELDIGVTRQGACNALRGDQ
jgi:hypothetical protein